MSDDTDKKTSKLTKQDVLLKGTIIAMIIAVPSLATFLITWVVLDDLITAMIIGAIIHFIAMGFSLKISKKLLVKK